MAKVIPIFKKGCAHEVKNYRPISLLPVMSKIVEKLIYRRLVSFLNQQNFFHKYQFNFRKNHSTNHATTLLVENITRAFEEKQATIGIFLDLSKAFDIIEHKILMSKLQHYGVRGLLLQLLSGYLSNRSQKVLFNGKILKSLYLSCKVPQGSILGPLFLIYVNDFPKCLTTGKPLMFADDTNVFFSKKTFKKLFAVTNQQLKNIDNWLTSGKLSLSIDKTNYIVFHTPHSKIPENTNLKQVQCITFLRVFVHENLNWKPHMELLQKIKVCYGIVRKIQPYLNKKRNVLQCFCFTML